MAIDSYEHVLFFVIVFGFVSWSTTAELLRICLFWSDLLSSLYIVPEQPRGTLILHKRVFVTCSTPSVDVH